MKLLMDKGRARRCPQCIPGRTALAAGAVLGWEMEQERGEMGSDFHLPCLGLLGHLPLPHSLLLLHGAKVWEWEMLVWGENKG